MFLLLSRSTNSSLEELRSACSSGLEKWVARLRSESASLKAETKANEEVGRGVTVKVMQSAAPNECDKYKLHVEETDKITSLLLGLTARMARMENSIAASAATASQDQKVRNILLAFRHFLTSIPGFFLQIDHKTNQ